MSIDIDIEPQQALLYHPSYALSSCMHLQSYQPQATRSRSHTFSPHLRFHHLWTHDGFKPFSSTTDTHCTSILARVPEGGYRGLLLQTFLILLPILNGTVIQSCAFSHHRSALKSVFVRRLKTNMGMHISLPTTELSPQLG